MDSVGQEPERAHMDGLPLLHHVWSFTWEDSEAGMTQHQEAGVIWMPRPGLGGGQDCRPEHLCAAAPCGAASSGCGRLRAGGTSYVGAQGSMRVFPLTGRDRSAFSMSVVFLVVNCEQFQMWQVLMKGGRCKEDLCRGRRCRDRQSTLECPKHKPCGSGQSRA